MNKNTTILVINRRFEKKLCKLKLFLFFRIVPNPYFCNEITHLVIINKL